MSDYDEGKVKKGGVNRIFQIDKRPPPPAAQSPGFNLKTRAELMAEVERIQVDLDEAWTQLDGLGVHLAAVAAERDEAYALLREWLDDIEDERPDDYMLVLETEALLPRKETT